MPNKKIGFLIKQVFYLHEQHLNKQFSKFGLTASQTFTSVSYTHLDVYKRQNKSTRL